MYPSMISINFAYSVCIFFTALIKQCTLFLVLQCCLYNNYFYFCSTSVRYVHFSLTVCIRCLFISVPRYASGDGIGSNDRSFWVQSQRASEKQGEKEREKEQNNKKKPKPKPPKNSNNYRLILNALCFFLVHFFFCNGKWTKKK